MVAAFRGGTGWREPLVGTGLYYSHVVFPFSSMFTTYNGLFFTLTSQIEL